MEMKIRESCLQTGTFIYKPGILVTKQDFHLQSGSLVLQMGFSGYYLSFLKKLQSVELLKEEDIYALKEKIHMNRTYDVYMRL